MSRDESRTASGAPIRVGVVGAGGQLGTCLVREISRCSRAELAFATTREDLDLTELEDLDAWLDRTLQRSLDVVINAAAFTKVDACESQAELAYQVNALAPATWARSLAERDVRFVHISTDYVFPGDGDRPYREDDPSQPRTVYGASKRAGEVAVLGTHPGALVIRTSWLFGPGRNFVAAILDQAEQRRRGEIDGPLMVVDDQVGSPTSAADLSRALLQICLDVRASGLLHICNSGHTTWYEFARKILELSGHEDVEIVPVATSAFETAADRPAYSVLDCTRAREMGIELRPWEDALASYLSEFDPARQEWLEGAGARPAHEVQG